MTLTEKHNQLVCEVAQLKALVEQLTKDVVSICNQLAAKDYFQGE